MALNDVFLIVSMIIPYLTAISNEIAPEIIEELESLYHYPHDKIALSIKYAKSKEEAIHLIERMSNDVVFYQELLEVSRRKDDSMNSLNPIEEHHEMIVIVRKDLRMSIGKTAAQVGHAVLLTYRKAIEAREEEVMKWEASGQAKIVLGIDSLGELMELKTKADSLGIPNVVVADAGYTEVLPKTVTCIGIGPGTVKEMAAIRGKLQLL